MTDPFAAISNAPKITITVINGANHSFFRTRKKAQSSLIKDIIDLNIGF